MSDRFALAAGVTIFLTADPSAAASSIASARSRFSFPFSSSSCFSRLASETSSPPNLAFHPQNVALLADPVLPAHLGGR